MNLRSLVTLGCLSWTLTISPLLLAGSDTPPLNTSFSQAVENGGKKQTTTVANLAVNQESSNLSAFRLGNRGKRDELATVVDSVSGATPSTTATTTTDTATTTSTSTPSTEVINAQNVADCLEIFDKIGLYTYAWDEGKSDLYSKVYTDDIVFEVWTPGKTEILYLAKGIPEVIAANQATAGAARQNGVALRHYLSQVVFLELTSSTAKTKAAYTFSFFPQVDSGVPLILSGTFNDSWVKTAKGWLVKERAAIYDNFPDFVKLK